jgi:transcriptional regulator GlxA family with amidase domain
MSSRAPELRTAPLRVDDLAEMAGMGVSTLHHHFRVLTAMSPVQNQKQLRLQAARARRSLPHATLIVLERASQWWPPQLA